MRRWITGGLVAALCTLALMVGCATQSSTFKEAGTKWKHRVWVFGKSKIDESMISTSYILETRDVEGTLAQRITQGSKATGMESEEALVEGAKAISATVADSVLSGFLGWIGALGAGEEMIE